MDKHIGTDHATRAACSRGRNDICEGAQDRSVLCKGAQRPIGHLMKWAYVDLNLKTST